MTAALIQVPNQKKLTTDKNATDAAKAIEK